MEVIIDFSNKTVVVTGGASGIGKTICDEFKKYGANVCVIDKRENDYFTGDIADENTLRSFTQKVIGNPLDIANIVLYLCSDKAGFITGQDFCIDGGMTKQMIYHNDFGWTFGE